MYHAAFLFFFHPIKSSILLIWYSTLIVTFLPYLILLIFKKKKLYNFNCNGLHVFLVPVINVPVESNLAAKPACYYDKWVMCAIQNSKVIVFWLVVAQNRRSNVLNADRQIKYPGVIYSPVAADCLYTTHTWI